MAQSVYDFSVKAIDGREVSLKEYQGKTLLIVNVASQCGLTPQYTGLQALYEKFKNKGFEILGFPCNQFGAQEPGTEKEIQSFCDMNYRVTFPLFKKIEVNGDGTHPLYAYMKKQKSGLMGSEAIKWNFTKFLINKEGKVLERFAPTTTPESIEDEIKKVL